MTTTAIAAGTTKARGFAAETTALDMGYDTEAIHAGCEARDSRPIIPLKQTPGVKRGDHRPPECEHGTWTFAGSDPARGASKWRCPTGECKPGSRWIKADRLHPLVPRRSGGSRSTEVAGPSSASSDGSRMSGRCSRSACEGSSGFGSMPT